MLIFTRSEFGLYASARISANNCCWLQPKLCGVRRCSSHWWYFSNKKTWLQQVLAGEIIPTVLSSLFPDIGSALLQNEWSRRTARSGKAAGRSKLHATAKVFHGRVVKAHLTNISFSKVRWACSGAPTQNEKLHSKLTPWKSQTFSEGSLRLKRSTHPSGFANKAVQTPEGEQPAARYHFRAEHGGSNFERWCPICGAQIRACALTSIGNTNTQKPLKSFQLQARQGI